MRKINITLNVSPTAEEFKKLAREAVNQYCQATDPTSPEYPTQNERIKVIHYQDDKIETGSYWLFTPDSPPFFVGNYSMVMDSSEEDEVAFD